MNTNRMRLDAILRLFDISISDAAKVAGVSRSLVSKLASGDPRVDGSVVFMRLEKYLGDLISKRRRSFFVLDAVSGEAVRSALDTVGLKVGSIHEG
ncbi:MAG: helix-turn-helix transcriptional regulator [Desulfuromonadales bacterium]|nr:helix-turn-helix transcriptional regulator [Desulfuromonadales bacterium]